jgi:hypothetical protein
MASAKSRMASAMEKRASTKFPRLPTKTCLKIAPKSDILTPYLIVSTRKVSPAPDRPCNSLAIIRVLDQYAVEQEGKQRVDQA